MASQLKMPHGGLSSHRRTGSLTSQSIYFSFNMSNPEDPINADTLKPLRETPFQHRTLLYD